jgi:hypothetical protein
MRTNFAAPSGKIVTNIDIDVLEISGVSLNCINTALSGGVNDYVRADICQEGQQVSLSHGGQYPRLARYQQREACWSHATVPQSRHLQEWKRSGTVQAIQQHH